jgi:hypothetical protein
VRSAFADEFGDDGGDKDDQFAVEVVVGAEALRISIMKMA